MADEKNIVDEEDAEAQKSRTALPMQWQSGNEVVAESALIQKPTGRQLSVFQNQRVRTCGMCKHFRRGYFQQIREFFMQALVHEYEWDPRFVGSNPHQMGRCMQDSELAVGPNSLGCEVFKAK